MSVQSKHSSTFSTWPLKLLCFEGNLIPLAQKLSQVLISGTISAEIYSKAIQNQTWKQYLRKPMLLMPWLRFCQPLGHVISNLFVRLGQLWPSSGQCILETESVHSQKLLSHLVWAPGASYLSCFVKSVAQGHPETDGLACSPGCGR